MSGTERWQPRANPWVVAIIVTLGAFMEVLDTTIVNVSLPHIAGSLSISADESTWTLTTYLVANGIVLTISGALSRRLGRKNYFLICIAAFTAASFACGISENFQEILIFRALQGFFGGGLQPTQQAIILDHFPPEKRQQAFSLTAIAIIIAPVVGPVVGGYLTDTYSWHWIFYINLLPGLVLIWAVWYGLDAEPMQLERLRRGDWVGILCMAIGLGSLITVLEEGERKEWFGSPMIQHLTILAAIFIPAFVIIELWHREPFINLRLWARRGFASASFMGFVMGLGLYGTVYILPVYLAQIQGYNALQIGEVVMWLGLPQLAIFPLVPFVMKRIDPRLTVGFGLILFAISCFMNSFLTHDWGIEQLRWSQLVRAVGQPFVITPLSVLAAGSLPQGEQAGGSAIFNIMRNLGGSVGIAMLSYFITEREHYHFSIIGNHLTQNSLSLARRIDELTGVLAPKASAVGLSRMQAIAEVTNTVRVEAYVMAYSDSFFVIGISLILAALALFLVPKPRSGEAAAA
jgi:DHA2 family multidrug resistance protein